MRAVLTVWPPVFASISGSITTVRDSLPSCLRASEKSCSPARAIEFSNGTGAGATNVCAAPSLLEGAAGEAAGTDACATVVGRADGVGGAVEAVDAAAGPD